MIVVPVSLRKGKAVVVPGRVELPTSTLSVWRSNQLSYRTVFITSVAETFDGCRIQKGAACLLSVSVTVSFFFRRSALVSPNDLCFQKGGVLCLLGLKAELRRTSLSVSRKEVFQPHLPVRLPCYDLAPITSFTLGRPSRSRLSGTPGFHGLTGGVYKARERIHRAMADARLLANPASWSRVADSNPN